ncbi:MAG: hypothetical protein J2P36_24480 [Ktedonobacteraceae bacterium]|nr:hypothetical protein [Ktedonobacteraceae bacterium]
MLYKHHRLSLAERISTTAAPSASGSHHMTRSSGWDLQRVYGEREHMLAALDPQACEQLVVQPSLLTGIVPSVSWVGNRGHGVECGSAVPPAVCVAAKWTRLGASELSAQAGAKQSLIRAALLGP